MATTQGRVAIAVASTRVALATAQEVSWVEMRAFKDNQGVLKIGSVTVTCDGSATDGRSLWPGDPLRLKACDLADVYINGKVVGDAVEYCAAYEGWAYSAECGVATTVIKASAGVFHGVLIETDGDNTVTVQIYDHPSAATNPITPSIVVPGGDRYGGVVGWDVVCDNGIVIVLSGTNGVGVVSYR